MAGDASLDREACSEVPACEVQSCTNDEVRNFRDGLSADKGEPMVCFGLAFVSKSHLWK